MTDSTTLRSRITRALGLSAAAFLLVATACGTTSVGGDPKISAKEDRGSSGVLEGLTVKGRKFTPNGEVLVQVLLVGNGPNANQYIEEKIQADANGKINFERRPLPCPTATGYGAGSWTWVSARDTSTGISGDDPITPGSAPDCTSS